MTQGIRLVRVALLVGAGLLVSGPAWAANVVRGVVQDEMGTGIANAKVVVNDVDGKGRQVMGMSTTDRYGRYVVKYKNQRWDGGRGVEVNPDIQVTVFLAAATQPAAMSQVFRNHDQTRDLQVSLTVTEAGAARLASTTMASLEAIPVARLEAACHVAKNGPRSGATWQENHAALKKQVGTTVERIEAVPYSGHAPELVWIYHQLYQQGKVLKTRIGQLKTYNERHLEALETTIRLIAAHREGFIYYGKELCETAGDGWDQCGCLTHGGRTPAQNVSQCHPYCSKYGFADDDDCSATYVP